MAQKFLVSVATQSLWDRPIEKAIEFIGSLELPGIELVVLDPWFSLEALKSRKKEITRRLSEFHLEVASLTTITNFTESVKVWENVQFAGELIDLCADYRTDTVKLSSGPPASGQSGQEDWDLLARSFAPVVQHAEKQGVKLAVETHLNMLTDTIAGARKFLELFQSPVLGLTLDFCNLMVDGDDPVPAVQEFGARTFLCHVKDGVLPPEGPPQWLPLGEGSLDYPAILRALSRSPYQGYLSLECLVGDKRYNERRLRELQGPEGVIKHDLDVLNGLLADIEKGG